MKVFQFFDYATLRTTDLLVTTKDYLPLNVENTNVELILDDTEVRHSGVPQVSLVAESAKASEEFII